LSGLDGCRATHVLVPLTVERRVRGVVHLGFARPRRLDPDEVAAATGLAAVASAAFERALLLTTLRAQLARLETLYRLGEVVSASWTPTALRRRLNRLLADTGFRVEAIALTERRIARRLGWPSPSPHGVASCELRGRRTGSVPLRNGRHVVGELLVTPADTSDGFLVAVATGVAESLCRAAAQAALQESLRDRALANERERIAVDLHDTVGQSLVATMLLARRAAEELPSDSEWTHRFTRIADVAAEGKWALDAAIRALAFVPAARAGLPTALRAFCRSVAEDSGLHVEFHVTGRTRRLPVATERALYRIGHQAVSNAWRHARASMVTTTVNYGDDSVTLRVQDDGIGLALRPEGDVVGVGFTSMRRAVAELGGRLSVTSVKPSGLAVEAVVPRRQP
jgi:signal transduction histidine kinase